MRLVEITLVVFSAITCVAVFSKSISPKVKFKVFPVVIAINAVVQFVFEGFRWQLWPVYFVVGVFLMLAVIDSWKNVRGGIFTFSAIIGLILVIVSVLAMAAFPLPIFQTTGQYQVGTIIYHLVDEKRTEMYGPEPGGPREIVVQVWYPAELLEDSKRAKWMADMEQAAPAIADWIEMPSFILDHLVYAEAGAYVDAPMIAGTEKFPVLVFSHGYGGFKEQNIFQTEELASHGYVVVAINHTYGAILTVFPDGRIADLDPATLPNNVTDEEYIVAANLLMEQWAGDIGFVLDEMEKLNVSDPDGLFTNRLDLNMVGVFGHSTGGGATVEFCGIDSRCVAALGMDTYVKPVHMEVLEAGIHQPMLLMKNENWVSRDNTGGNSPYYFLMTNTSTHFLELTIEGTKHFDFSALPLLSPLAVYFGIKGPIDGERVLEIINLYSVAFFDQYLKGEPQPILDGPRDDYPEVEYGDIP